MMGDEVLLMQPAYTRPYVKRGKNDAVDAEAICQAASRPGCVSCRSKTRSNKPRRCRIRHANILQAVMSTKFALLIGIPAVGLHQGQRTYAPHQQCLTYNRSRSNRSKRQKSHAGPISFPMFGSDDFFIAGALSKEPIRYSGSR